MGESEWVVMLETVTERPVTDDQADELFDELAAHHAVVSYLGSTLSVEMLISAVSASEAIVEGGIVLQKGVAVAGLGETLRLTLASAMTPGRHAQSAQEPVIPTLLGVAEVSERLGVSKQRVSQYDEIAGFPKPLAVLKAGPVWAEPTLRRFTESWDRKPGRPRTKDKPPKGEVAGRRVPA